MQLTVTPIDTTKPGSFGQQRRLVRVIHLMQDSAKERDFTKISAAYDSVADILASSAKNEDGQPITLEDIDGLSHDDALELFKALTGRSDEDAASPLTNTGSDSMSAVTEPALNGSLS